MMRLGVLVQAGPNGRAIKDIAPFMTGGEFSMNEHGFESFSAQVDLDLLEAFYLYDFNALPHISVQGMGWKAWEGRLEDTTLGALGLQLHALGYQNGYRDKRNVYSPAAYNAATSFTIASDIATAVNAANAFMPSSSLLIGDPGVTWTETYLRQTPATILDRLAERGDGVNRWEWGVYDDRLLHFRARGADGRAWYVDVTNAFTAVRTLENIWNSVYGLYGSLLTAEAADSYSQDRYGVKREISVNANTDALTAAQNSRDAFLDFYSDGPARGDIEVTALYDAFGVHYPLWLARSGDTVTMRNLPPNLSTDIDSIRSWRIARTSYKFGQTGQPDKLRLTPEFALPAVI